MVQRHSFTQCTYNGLSQKVQKFEAMLGIENFQASVGWLNRFHTHYAIVMKSIWDETSNVPTKTVNQWRAGEVTVVIKTYNSTDVFYADEADIFY